MTKKRYKLEKAWGIGGQFPHSFLRKAYFPLILFSTLYPSSRENHNLYLDCKKGWQKERREPFVIVFPVFDTWLSCFETRPRIMLIRIDVGSLSSLQVVWGCPWKHLGRSETTKCPRGLSVGGNIRISLGKTKTCQAPLSSPTRHSESWARIKETNCQGLSTLITIGGVVVSIAPSGGREDRCLHTWQGVGLGVPCSTTRYVECVGPFTWLNTFSQPFKL